jgi:spermidine synthase
VWYGQNGVWLWMAFFSGFGLLAFEIVGLQLIMLVAPLSFHAPTAILSVVIMMLVIGACVATGLTRNWGRGHDPALGQRWMLRSLMGTGVALILTAPWFFWLSPRIGTDSAPSLPVFLGQVMGLATLAFGPALLFAGQLFPLTFLAYSREQGDLGGRSWAWLLAANGIGGLLGAEFAYRLLLPSLGVNSSIAALGLLYLGSGWLVSQMRQDWEGDRMGRWMAALCGGVIVTWGWVAQLPEVNPYLGFKVVHQQAGAEGSLAIVERADFGRAILVSNQYLLGSTGAMADQRRQTHLPLLLHPAPKNVAFVGLATGITPGAALQDPVVDQVTAVEISRSVVHVAQAYFAAENLGIVDHPRARVIVEDGRTYIASQEEAYDVIVGDLYLPWAAGASRLYSVEHFAACRRALRSGGLFCQWLPMHQLTEPQLRRIVASYRVAFPDVHLIVNSFSARAPALGLVGWRDGDWDWQTIESRCRQARLGSEMTQPSLRYREGVAMHYLGRLSPGDLDAAPITLDNLWLELDAGRRQVTGKYVAQTEPYLANQTWRDWFAAAQIGQCSVVRSDAWTARRQLTHELLEWEAQLQNKDPNASLNGRRFKEQFPEPWWLEIRTWGRQWPGPNPIPN